MPGATGSKTPTGVNGIRFRQELNTYVWQLGFRQQWRWNQKWQVYLQEQFKSSLLHLGNNQNKWKDEQDVAVMLNFRLLPKLTLVGDVHSIIFLDKQSGFHNDIHSYGMAAGFHYRPNERLSIKSSAGPRWEKRLLQHDVGRYYALDATADAVEWGDYRNYARVALARDEYDRRKNHDAQIDYRVGRLFSAGSADSLRFFFNQRRRDNYTSEAGDVESLREGAKGVENHLVYGIAANVFLRLQNSFVLRDVELVSFANKQILRRRKRNDEVGDHTLVLDWRPKRWYGRLTLSYIFQSQKYEISRIDERVPFSQRTAFITPDNQSHRLFLSNENMLAIGYRDSVFSYASISRFQYDTPDTNNFDDRDELRINTRLVWAHVFQPSLRGELQASVNLYHMVYIFGERSADNNWNRVFRLRPVLAYTIDKTFRWWQAFEVLANYVDYDFEPADGQTKSFVFRKFAYDDSLRFRLTPRSTLTCDYRLQLEENGELFWEQWKERVLTTRTSHWLQLRWTYRHHSSLEWAPGYTFYVRNEWRHGQNGSSMSRKKYQSFSSHGPLFALNYLPSKKIRITLDAVRRKVLPFKQKNYYINTIDLRLDVLF